MTKPLHDTYIVKIDISLILILLRNYILEFNLNIFKNELIPYNLGYFFKQLEDVIIETNVIRILGLSTGLNIERELSPELYFEDANYRHLYITYYSKLNSLLKFEMTKFLTNDLVNLNLLNIVGEDKVYVSTNIENNTLTISITKGKENGR